MTHSNGFEAGIVFTDLSRGSNTVMLDSWALTDFEADLVCFACCFQLDALACPWEYSVDFVGHGSASIWKPMKRNI